MAWGVDNALMTEWEVYLNAPSSSRLPNWYYLYGSDRIITLDKLNTYYNYINNSGISNPKYCPPYKEIGFSLPWDSGLLLHLSAKNVPQNTITWQNLSSYGSAYNFTLNSFVFGVSEGWVNNGLVNKTEHDAGSGGVNGKRWCSSNFLQPSGNGTVIFKWYNGYGRSGYQNDKFILGNSIPGGYNNDFLLYQGVNSSEITFSTYSGSTRYQFKSTGANLQVNGTTGTRYSTIAFVYNGPVWTFYVDGVERGTGNYYTLTNNSLYKWALFSFPNGGLYSSSGALKGVLVYDRALTLDEINLAVNTALNF